MADHGGREPLHEPSAWLMQAIHDAQERAVPCEHYEPGRPAGLVLRTGWLCCQAPECAASTPVDMRAMPPGGSPACDRCGSAGEVRACLVSDGVLDVLFLLCSACYTADMPATEAPNVGRPGGWLAGAVKSALIRMRPCGHLTPDPPLKPAVIELHSGSITCQECEVPPDVGGRQECDRCGVLTTVEGRTRTFGALTARYRLCLVCVELEAPNDEAA